MAYLFQVFVHRELSPEDGQRRLEVMIQEIDRLKGQRSLSAIRTLENTHESPFPDWLSRILEHYGFTYESINFCYMQKFQAEQEAVATMTWFDQVLRPWIANQGDGYGKFLQKVHVRVMDDHEAVYGLPSY